VTKKKAAPASKKQLPKPEEPVVTVTLDELLQMKPGSIASIEIVPKKPTA
jgi:hypothetical protein